MFKQDAILKLELCLDHLLAIDKYFGYIKNAEDLFILNDGVYYDAVLMRLQALSETLKNLNRKHPQVIESLQYASIGDLIKFRDLVSHHYEKLEYEIIYNICAVDLPKLKKSITEILKKI
ncbi:MAG TPA: HepT-like ribonuclease domain-containing protein [Chitinophagaceae bacterium]|nr:HepT-like ribonuclease domain-containing protein [Chitinophagaceae bacterium]